MNKTRAMYASKAELMAADRDLLELPLDDRLRMPPDSLIAWVQSTYDIVRQCILEAQDAAAAGCNDIRTYFARKSATNRIRRKLPRRPKPKRKTKRALPTLQLPLPPEPATPPTGKSRQPRQRTLADFVIRAPQANRQQNPYTASQRTKQQRKPKTTRQPSYRIARIDELFPRHCSIPNKIQAPELPQKRKPPDPP